MSELNSNIINNYLCRQLSYNKNYHNLEIDNEFKKINSLKEKHQILLQKKNNLENIMKNNIKINHHSINLNKLIYKSENNYESLDDFVKQNKIKFRVLIHIFKYHIQKYFLKKNNIQNYTEQLILDTVTSVIDKQLDKAPSISSFGFVQLINSLCKILSKIEYKFDLLKKIKDTENMILQYPQFVGGSKNIYTINYTKI